MNTFFLRTFRGAEFFVACIANLDKPTEKGYNYREDSVCGFIYHDVPYYFQKNLQGDIIAVVDASGEVHGKYSYDAWGKCTIVYQKSGSTVASANPFRYRGYYLDSETGFYYLNSRYYDPSTGRFINGDDVSYLGIGGTPMSYNLLTYCENDCVDFVDYFGHTPSLSTLTRMHNAVVKSAQTFLLSVGTITMSEVQTCDSKGRYIGRMDIYSYIFNRVWEVKRNNSNGIRDGFKQLTSYTSSYVYSLYHSWFRTKRTPKYGNISVYGATVVLDYLVFYHSLSTSALIVYDYMPLERAAELIFDAVKGKSADFKKALQQYSKSIRDKVTSVLLDIRKFFGDASVATQRVLNDIMDFLRRAGFIVFMIIAIIMLLFVGVCVFS